MTNRDPKYRCLVCAEKARMLPTSGPRAVARPPEVIVRRPGKHSNHRHPGRVRFEKVEKAA